MKLQNCRMVQVVAVSRECVEKGATDIFPIAEIIIIDPSHSDAEEHAKQELKSFIHEGIDYQFQTKDLGSIFFPPHKTTIFLYTQGAGRIK